MICHLFFKKKIKNKILYFTINPKSLPFCILQFSISLLIILPHVNCAPAFHGMSAKHPWQTSSPCQLYSLSLPPPPPPSHCFPANLHPNVLSLCYFSPTPSLFLIALPAWQNLKASQRKVARLKHSEQLVFSFKEEEEEEVAAGQGTAYPLLCVAPYFLQASTRPNSLGCLPRPLYP